MEDNKKEATEKIIMLILVVAVFAGVYYFYAKQSNDKSSTKSVSNAAQAKQVSASKKAPAAIKPKDKPEEKKVEKTAKYKKEYYRNKISNKYIMLRIARTGKGKIDPFVNTTGRMEGLAGGSFNSMNFSDLPAMEFGSGKTIATEPLSLKGFLGEKAIIRVNGSTKAMALNETFKGVTLVELDVDNLTVKLKQDGQVYIKTIHVPDNKDFNIIKKV